MTTRPPLDRAARAFRFVLAAAAIWTLMGAIPGYLDPASSFERFHGAPADSAVVLELYQGAWGQTLLFAVGYAIAAFDPRRHALVIALGAVGKLLYAARILASIAERPPTPLALTGAIGDLVFVTLFVVLLVATRSKGRALATTGASRGST